MSSKKQKNGTSRAAERAPAEVRRRIRKRVKSTLLDPPKPVREYRSVKAIAESTKDFKTGRYEP